MINEKIIKKTYPLISVIIPVHNAEEYLEECVNSVLVQTYTNLEILLVDDNSTDGSINLGKQLAQRDSRILHFVEHNGSAGLTRNFGLNHMSGNYLFFLDSDDKINPETIEHLYDALKDVKIGFSISKFTNNQDKFERNQGIGEVKKLSANFLEKLKGIQASDYPSFGPIGKLYTRNIFEDIRYPNLTIHEDTAIILPIVDRAKDIFLVDSLDYYYRVNSGSITQSKITEKNEAIFIKNDFQINFVKDKYPEALNYIYQLCMNENDYVAMKCIKDGSSYAIQLFEKIYKQNQYFSKQSHSRKFLYKSKILYKIYLGISVRVWNNDFIRGLAKKILT